MENALQVFSYNGTQVRTTKLKDEIWFVAKDVCDILELGNITEALRELDEDEKGFFRISEGTSPKGGNPNMIIITEPGLYALVFKSRKPEAKAFSRWVRHEVLPQIRKTGSYSLPKAQGTFAIDAAIKILEHNRIEGNQLTLALDKVYKRCTGFSLLETAGIALEAPAKHQILTPTDIGKHFGLTAQEVNEKLAGAGWQHKIAGKWEPLEPAGHYAVMQDTGKKHSDGTPVRQLKWESSILDCFIRISSTEN